MEIGMVQVNAAINVEITFEQSLEVTKNDVEGLTAVFKESAGVVRKFIAVERNLNNLDLTLAQNLNSGIVEQKAVGQDKSVIVAGMTFCKFAKRIRKILNKVDGE